MCLVSWSVKGMSSLAISYVIPSYFMCDSLNNEPFRHKAKPHHVSNMLSHRCTTWLTKEIALNSACLLSAVREHCQEGERASPLTLQPSEPLGCKGAFRNKTGRQSGELYGKRNWEKNPPPNRSVFLLGADDCRILANVHMLKAVFIFSRELQW